MYDIYVYTAFVSDTDPHYIDLISFASSNMAHIRERTCTTLKAVIFIQYLQLDIQILMHTRTRI